MAGNGAGDAVLQAARRLGAADPLTISVIPAKAGIQNIVEIARFLPLCPRGYAPEYPKRFAEQALTKRHIKLTG
jgi:hypothetical protein